MVPKPVPPSISCEVEGYPAVNPKLTSPSPNITYHNVLCEVSGLSYGPIHKMVFTNKLTGDYLGIDYFQIIQPLLDTSTTTMIGNSLTTDVATASSSPTSDVPATSNASANTKSSGAYHPPSQRRFSCSNVYTRPYHRSVNWWSSRPDANLGATTLHVSET